MAAQLSVRLLFLSGDEEGDGGDVDCCLGLWGCHLGCVAVRASVRTVPLFAGGLAFYEAVLAFSAAYFGVVVGGVFCEVWGVWGERWGWCGFPVAFLCVSGDSEGRVLVFLGGVCGYLCFCAEWVFFGRGVTLGVTERGYTFGGRGVTKLGAGGGWLMGGNVPFLWSWI